MNLTNSKETDFINLFAKSIGTILDNGILNFPADVGSGYIRRIHITENMHIVVRNYELKKAQKITRKNVHDDKNRVVIVFDNILKEKDDCLKDKAFFKSQINLPSASISNVPQNEEVIIPAHVKTSSIIIVVNSEYLKELLNYKQSNNLVETIVSGDKSFVFDEIISPQLIDLAAEIVKATIDESLHALYFRSKAEELIYLLLVELLKRNESKVEIINCNDVKIIYQVRDKILENINERPNLEDLVMFSAMSKTKLQKLFKQVFGNSIYNYYLSIRMRQAADMIERKGLSISEIGYQMGFSNLSHFSRMFESHIGVKPKKFASCNK